MQILNNLGELYALSTTTPHFLWIQDLSPFGNISAITPGNNGLVYITVPARALILALDVSRGNISWQGSVGPLSTADYAPVVDSNGEQLFCISRCASLDIKFARFHCIVY